MELGDHAQAGVGAERRDQLPQSLVVVAAAQLVHRRVCGLLQFAGNGHGQVGDIQWLAGVPRERLAIDDDLYSGRLAIDINRTAGDVNDVSVV